MKKNLKKKLKNKLLLKNNLKLCINETKINLLLKKIIYYFYNINYKLYFRKIKIKKKLKKRFYNKNFFFIKNLKNKKHISFYKICIIQLKHTNNNFYIILTDLNGKVISYSSAGKFKDFDNNIRKKRSPYLVFLMMTNIIKKIKNLKIKNIRIYIKSNISQHMYKVLSILKKNKIKIQHIFFIKPIPHHKGQRKKKLKRL